jgi:bifunctional non-homologous end joining protein LigD
VSPPILHPAAPLRIPNAFDHDRFIFELKQDRFRALAYIAAGECRLVSRRDNLYKSFAPLCKSLVSLTGRPIVLDGEIVSLDAEGRPQFYDLLRHRGTPVFYAFDCLWHESEDIRSLPLLQRKQILKRAIGEHPSILFAQHIEALGHTFSNSVCDQDLEGIVAKRKDAAYGVDWFKIRNPNYSQYEGRRELFEKRISRGFG